MTLTEILTHAANALDLAKSLPVGDPRVALALQLVGAAVTLLTSLNRQGILGGGQTIEVDEMGVALFASIQRQLDALNAEAPA